MTATLDLDLILVYDLDNESPNPTAHARCMERNILPIDPKTDQFADGAD